MADEFQVGSRFRVKDSEHTGVFTKLEDETFSIEWDAKIANHSPYANHYLDSIELIWELAPPMFSLEEIHAADL